MGYLEESGSGHFAAVWWLDHVNLWPHSEQCPQTVVFFE